MRAAIFIDGGYFLSLMKNNEITPRYDELADYLLKPLRKSVPLDLLRCYFYYCAPWMSPDPSESEKRRMEEHGAFMEEISTLERWAVRLGKLQRRWDGYKEYFEQKRVDVLLSVDMVRHSASGHIQHVIVIAGDSDFIPAIEATKESGATVSLWYGDESTIHKDLLALADITHQIDWKKVPKKKNKGKSLFGKSEKAKPQQKKDSGQRKPQPDRQGQQGNKSRGNRPQQSGQQRSKRNTGSSQGGSSQRNKR
ncbi:MAG: NYN domain-containing protein [bacterium]|nr:NYN domain-containing protein [bacterium]